MSDIPNPVNISDAHVEVSSQQENSPNPADEWHQKWGEFKENLRDPYRAFNQTYWIRTLLCAAVRYLLYATKTFNLARRIRSGTWWRQIIPFLAFALITFCVASYFLVFHEEIIIQRWCPCHAKGSQENHLKCSGETNKFCVWEYIHGSFVFYIATMIYWNYIRTSFLSPGFVMPSPTSSDEHEVDTNDVVQSQDELWTLRDSVGGCCFIRPTLNIKKEKDRVDLYKSSGKVISVSNGVRLFPSPDWTYCKKCKMKRPPRSHHCSVSKRCVLQMDHYCPWVNNCIGYYNYHSFLLALVFLVLGCGYGVAVLTPPFWDIMFAQFQQHGFKVFYENKTGILNLPFPSVLWEQYKTTGTIDHDVILKMVFLILFLVVVLLGVFLWTHLCYIKIGMTTIERSAVLHVLFNKALDRAEGLTNELPTLLDISNALNPFDRGLKKNLNQVFGENWFRILLPLPIHLPPPYVVLPTTKDE